MRLTNIRIKNFRTVSDEQGLVLNSGATIVGPNNTGKTNILQAIRMFFTGYENEYGYKRERDLTFGESRARTSIIANFKFEGEADTDVSSKLNEIRTLLGVSEETTSEIQLYLYFSPSSTPVYRFYPNLKRPIDNSQKAQYSRKEKELVNAILES